MSLIQVNIICGEINSGKTTKLASLYDQSQQGDGFLLKKIYRNDTYIGQRIERLSTKEARVFSLKEQYTPKSWDVLYQLDTYFFSRCGLDFAKEIANELILLGTSPVFLDEIGPLELMGKGFADIFINFLREKKELFITVRKSAVDEVINKFNIKDYLIIWV